MNARAFSEREAGPDAHEHSCAGGCGTIVEDADLCDPCESRYDAISELYVVNVTAADQRWYDAVNAVLDADGAA